jgi:hypothetical protein
MDTESSPKIDLRGSPQARLMPRSLLRKIATKLALLALLLMSTLSLGGCQAIEAIFKVGVGFGVMIVVTIVAVIGGGAALILRKR